MKNKIRKSVAAVLAAALLVCLIPVSVFASGSFYVSATSLTLTLGSSGGFSFGANNAVGFFEISTDGGVSASYSGDYCVDDESVYITVTAESLGTGHVYINVYDGTDYDGNDLSGMSFTVTVTIRGNTTTATTAETTTTEETTTKKSTTTTTETTTDETTTRATTTTTETTTTEETTTEETTTEETSSEETAEELLAVEIDGVSYTVLEDVSEITVPEGFSVEETEYNTVSVETMVFDDFVIYVLEEGETQTADYYILDEDTGEFEAVKYTTIDDDICIFLEMPEDLEIPYGYSLVEAEMYEYTLEALAVDEEIVSEGKTDSETSDSDDLSADEVSTESAAEIKAYDTVGAPAGTLYDEDDETDTDADETADEDETEGYTDPVLGDVLVTTADVLMESAGGHYYVYCIWGGEKVICDYDPEEDSLSKCEQFLALEEAQEEETVPETEEETQEEEASGWAALTLFEKILFAVLAVAAVVIILIIVLFAVRAKRKKNKQKRDHEQMQLDVENLELEEENLFEETRSSSKDDDEIYEALLKKSAMDLNARFSREKKNTAEQENFAEVSAEEEDVPETAPEENKTAGSNADAAKSKKRKGGVEDITEILTEEFQDMLKELGPVDDGQE